MEKESKGKEIFNICLSGPPINVPDLLGAGRTVLSSTGDRRGEGDFFSCQFLTGRQSAQTSYRRKKGGAANKRGIFIFSGAAARSFHSDTCDVGPRFPKKSFPKKGYGDRNDHPCGCQRVQKRRNFLAWQGPAAKKHAFNFSKRLREER